ncbi:MAG: NADH-quinone oxidoreductase subunit M [Oxalobacter sp.]|nr:MAG: NADH-quinone oxidoreductase subunit M [Oxalobacter sp.]
MLSHLPLLSIAIWTPIIFGILVFAIGRDDRQAFVRWFSLAASIISFLATLPIVYAFDKAKHGMQFVEKFAWIERFNIHYHFGIDGISLWFIVLTAFITMIVVIAGWVLIQSRVAQYMGALFVLSGLMIGVFCALDGLLFYVFFEATLIPMFIIIGIWGGSNRVYAAFKFFLYTLLGSLLMLIAVLYLYFKSGGSFDLQTWQTMPLELNVQIFIFLAFLAAFAVKVPMWPVHTWLPDAHVEAPTGGSVVLAAIMLKLGAYGFLRFSLPIAPDASHSLSGMMIVLSLIAIIYIGLVTLVQRDMKKLIAYSSVAHMGFVTLGFFLFNGVAMQGGIVQMISHGFVSGAMFLCTGVLYDRMHTREIAEYGGVVHTMPKFAVFFVLFSLANCGLPGTSGFVGESMVIWGSIKINFFVGAFAALALILAAAYSLWLVKRVIFGAVKNDQVAALQDIGKREFLILALMAIAVIAVGVYPAPLTEAMQVSVTDLLQHIARSKL